MGYSMVYRVFFSHQPDDLFGIYRCRNNLKNGEVATIVYYGKLWKKSKMDKTSLRNIFRVRQDLTLFLRIYIRDGKSETQD